MKAWRKRKRGQQQTKGSNITDENLADLWRKHIEGRTPEGKNEKASLKMKQRQKKKRKKGGELVGEEAVNGMGNKTLAKPKLGRDEERAEDTKPIEVNNIKPSPMGKTKLANYNGAPQTLQASVKKPGSELDGKAKYLQRKSLALEKQARKSLQQVNGDLPPLRPTQYSDMIPAPPAKSKSAKSSSRTSPTRLKSSPAPSTTARPSLPSPPPLIPSTRLTPLQTSMQQKLISARFRHLNQTLYTTPSAHASALFSESPASYASYHAGFRTQVAVWPQNPLDTFIADFKARAQVGVRGEPLGSQKKRWREQKQGKVPDTATRSENDNNAAIPALDPLPRSPRGLCTIADLGCGDATLAAKLAPLCKSHSLRVHSFDLAAGDGPNAHLITVADLCGTLPLPNSSIDVAVLCLALMGTNWVEGVREAARIVRPGGEVWVAEIRSRFARAGGVAPRAKGNRIGAPRHHDEDLQAELDSAEGRGGGSAQQKEETNVGPFVQVFRRRGFALRGEPDVGNRMFARMRFVKESSSGAAVPASADRLGSDRAGKAKRLMPATSGEEDDGGGVEEGKVLKPCVYKIR